MSVTKQTAFDNRGTEIASAQWGWGQRMKVATHGNNTITRHVTNVARGAKWLASMYLLTAASGAVAILPDSGWYFNANESGRGFNIEIQNNVLFMAGFLYDTTGKPIWVVSGGPMSSDRTYSGAAIQTANGQSLGGSYHAATSVPFGTASITFPTTTTASITVNGYSFTVTREQFGFDFTSTVQPLLGEFAFVDGTSTFPIYFGERISFSSTQVLSGSLYAVGNRAGDIGTNVAIAQFSPSLGKWIILLDASTSYYKFYTLIFEGDNLVEGDSYTYLKTDSPSGSLPSIGHRIKSAQAAAGLNAPGSGKSKVVMDSYMSANVAAQNPLPENLSSSLLDTLQQMESALQMMR
jgi:hypothetical protein